MQGSRAFLVLNILVWYCQASFVVYCIYDYEHFGCLLYSRVCWWICSLLELNVQLKRAAALANMPHGFILFPSADGFLYFHLVSGSHSYGTVTHCMPDVFCALQKWHRMSTIYVFIFICFVTSVVLTNLTNILMYVNNNNFINMHFCVWEENKTHITVADN